MDANAEAALIRAAKAVAKHAYAPASRFQVGAALLASDGRTFRGCNVECASFGLSICAERNAVFQAVAEGARRFNAIAIYTPRAEPGSPCGACRQVLAEFGPELEIVLCGDSDQIVRTTIGELLPRAFRFDFGKDKGA